MTASRSKGKLYVHAGVFMQLSKDLMRMVMAGVILKSILFNVPSSKKLSALGYACVVRIGVVRCLCLAGMYMYTYIFPFMCVCVYLSVSVCPHAHVCVFKHVRKSVCECLQPHTKKNIASS